MSAVPVYICRRGRAESLAKRLSKTLSCELTVKKPLEFIREVLKGKPEYRLVLVRNVSTFLNSDYGEPLEALTWLKRAIRKLRESTIILEVGEFRLELPELTQVTVEGLPIGFRDWKGTRDLKEYYNIKPADCIRVIVT